MSDEDVLDKILEVISDARREQRPPHIAKALKLCEAAVGEALCHVEELAP